MFSISQHISEPWHTPEEWEQHHDPYDPSSCFRLALYVVVRILITDLDCDFVDGYNVQPSVLMGAAKLAMLVSKEEDNFSLLDIRMYVGA